MPSIFIYVIARDFGFAPNPFHGVCTLATCKPKIRKHACINDWVVGVGGTRLKAKGRCIFGMKITEKLTFNEYWTHPGMRKKIPIRNGSNKLLAGDNIYFFDGNSWHQADSHHSNPDGSANLANLDRDTSSDAVLISSEFFYFGRNAPDIPPEIIMASRLQKNPRDYYRLPLPGTGTPIIQWLQSISKKNHILGDPFDFSRTSARYSVASDKIISN